MGAFVVHVNCCNLIIYERRGKCNTPTDGNPKGEGFTLLPTNYIKFYSLNYSSKKASLINCDLDFVKVVKKEIS